MDYIPLVSFPGCNDMSLDGVLCHSPSRQKVPVCVFKEDFHFYLRSLLPILLLPRVEIMVNGHFISEFILDTTLLVASYSCSFKRCSPWQAT